MTIRKKCFVTELGKAVAVAGCSTALTGSLDDTILVDYVTAKMVCPVSANFSVIDS